MGRGGRGEVAGRQRWAPPLPPRTPPPATSCGRCEEKSRRGSTAAWQRAGAGGPRLPPVGAPPSRGPTRGGTAFGCRGCARRGDLGVLEGGACGGPDREQTTRLAGRQRSTRARLCRTYTYSGRGKRRGWEGLGDAGGVRSQRPDPLSGLPITRGVAGSRGGSPPAAATSQAAGYTLQIRGEGNVGHRNNTEKTRNPRGMVVADTTGGRGGGVCTFAQEGAQRRKWPPCTTAGRRPGPRPKQRQRPTARKGGMFTTKKGPQASHSLALVSSRRGGCVWPSMTASTAQQPIDASLT